MKTILAADLFCGAGGTSQGLLMVANEMNADLTLVAVNHWQVAIDTHSLNHPYAQHLCTGLDNVDPRKLVPGGRLNVLCASPECTHHSNARGGKPMSDQSRASAWHVLRFCEALYVENLVIENVKEFRTWGPLGANGRPLKSKKGQLFEQFIANLKALGYRVEWRILNCADYGDPTTRERFFLIGRRGNKPIRWPEPTHVPATKITAGGLFAEERKPWRTAREIINWSLPSRSIFGRKKPLAENTLKRIEAGARKFWGLDIDLRRCMAENLRPFVVVLRKHADGIGLEEPIPTITAGGNHFGLVTPFIVTPTHGNKGKDDSAHRVYSADKPLGTVVTENRFAVAQAMLLPHPRKHDQPHGVDEPVRTVTATSSDLSLAEAFLIPQHGGGEPRLVECPTSTVATKGAISVVTPFLMQIDQTGGSGVVRSADAPIPTLVTKENTAVIEPYMVTVTHSGAERTRSVHSPMPTVTGSMGEGVVEPFLVQYYGSSDASSVDSPLPTATTKDRFGVVEARVEHYMLDIRFRMLTPRELARAQGFPDSYQFTGKREDVVKQIGNAVPPNTARALICELLA